MKAKTFLAAIAISIAATLSGNAATLAQWTFETSVPTTSGPHTPEGGVNAGASAGSTNTGGTITNPAGNASNESFASSGWAVGEYYQFSTSTVGYTGVTISFDQTGSATAPRDFKLQYSTDGTSFTDFGAGWTVSNDNWVASGTRNPASAHSFDLSSVTALNGDSSIFFRLTVTSTTAVGGGTVGTAGLIRIDNFTINAVPEPTAALLGLVGFFALLRRARR